MLFIIAYICNTKMLSNKLKIAHILFYTTHEIKCKNGIFLVYSTYSCNYFNLFIIYICVFSTYKKINLICI